MAGIVVQNTITDPGGNPYALTPVRINLIASTTGAPGYTATGDIIGQYATQTDTTGHWTATLTPNSEITPANTYYQVIEGGTPSDIVVPATGGPYNLSQILVTSPTTPNAPGITGLQVAANGTVAGSRPEINLVAGSNVTVSATDDSANDRVDVTITSTGGVQLAGDLGGTDASPQVVGTHLAAPLPITQGGTGQSTAQGALDALAGAVTAGDYLRGNGTNITLAAIQAGDLPAATTTTQGAVELDATTADLQPDGAPDPGNSGKAADGRHRHPLQPWQFLITDPAYGGGAKGTLDCVVDAVTNGTAVVTSVSGKFTAGMVGQAVVGKGFLTSGVTSLVTTVASYQSHTQVTLSAAATSSATGLQMIWGDDDTAAIQAAIDAAMAYGSPLGVAAQVIVPIAPGGLGYMIAGPLKNTDTAGNALYNSQLTTGLHSDRDPGLTLEIVGPADGAPTRHWNQDYPFFTGATWFSAGVFASQSAQATSIANGGNPSVLGGPTGKFGYGATGANPQFNNITARLINLSIMTTHSSSGWTYSPFNFYGTARAHLVRCGFGTNGVVQYYLGPGGSGGNTDFSNPATFSGGASLGGLMPAAGNNDDSVVEDCVWNGGHTYGPLLGEHTVCKGINRSIYNWIGVNVAGNYGDGGSGAGSLHAIDLGQFSVEACSYHLGVWGAGAAGIGPYLRGRIDTEGTVQVRGVTDIAANLQALSGELLLAGSPSTPAFTFPTNLHLVKETQTRGPVASPTYTLGTPQINTFWRDATVTISGGTVTGVKVSALAGGASAPTMTTIPGFTSGTFRVPSGCWWEIDGSVEPTSMQWILD